jgi:hypothetical protein
MSDLARTIPTLAELRARRAEIMALAARHGAYNVRVFGSVARGEAGTESDVDFLVTFQTGASLFDQSALWQDLQDLLGCEVNLLSEGGLNERFRKRIEHDLTAL